MKLKNMSIIGLIFILLLLLSVACEKTETADMSSNEHIKHDEDKSLSGKQIDANSDKKFIEANMKNVNIIGEWTYFIYDVSEKDNSNTITYPALFKHKQNESPIRVSSLACYNYQIVGDKVYYMDSCTEFNDHGILYVINPDGSNIRVLEEEVFNFQIINNQYIYYVFRHDTYGVGIAGHALQRMDLDGENKMIAAYKVSGAGFGCSHFSYRVEDNWLYGNDFRMELGAPADGFEKIELLTEIEDNDDEWIYYVTNRLIKARKDGSEQIELDGEDTYHYEIDDIDKTWIYYTKGGIGYKIKKDGTDKTRLSK